MCHPRFQAGVLLKPECTLKKGSQGFLLPSAEGSLGPSTQCFPYKLNKTEMSGERTLGYTTDELFVTD
jgi:hypothetical protein